MTPLNPACNLTTDLVSTVEPAFEGLVPEWRELWRQSGDREPYSHPGWLLAYRRNFEPSAQVLVITVRKAGRLVAVLPLVRERTVVDGMPVRVMRAPMNEHSFGFHVLADTEATLQVPCAIVNRLAALPGWDLLLIQRYASRSFADQLGRCAPCHGFPALRFPHSASRCIAIPEPAAGGDEPWMAPVDGGLKKTIRRSLRLIGQDFDGDLVLDTRHDADPEALARFYDIEASGWKGREGTAIKCVPATLQFYNEVAKAFAEDGALRLQFLRVGATLLAGSFNVVAGGRSFVLKWAYDDAYSRYGPGQVLCKEMLRDGSERGLTALDLGEDAPYKREWTPVAEPHESVYLFNRTVYGRLLYAYRASIRPAIGRLRRSWQETADRARIPAQH